MFDFAEELLSFEPSELVRGWSEKKHDELSRKLFIHNSLVEKDYGVIAKVDILVVVLLARVKEKSQKEWLDKLSVVVNDLARLFQLNGGKTANDFWTHLLSVLNPDRLRKSRPEYDKQKIQREILKLSNLRNKISAVTNLESKLVRLALEAQEDRRAS